MRILHALDELAGPGDLHLAIGIFDGVHIGHQTVIESAVRTAQVRGGESGVLTFTPHPTRVLGNPELATKLFQPTRQKELVLEQLGVRLLVWHPFTREFASIPAEAFVASIQKLAPGLRTLHVGENFRFGKGRAGDVDLMVRTARPLGIHVISVQRLRMDGEPISSTRIREAIQQGQIALVNDLLGYCYFSISTVKEGKRLGRTLGFPTLNLPWNPECRPRLGVYAVRVSKEGGAGSGLPAVANYGVRPTVEQAKEPVLEVHLLGDTCPFGAGDTLRVEWLHFIRPEQKFEGIEALAEQIGRDKDATLHYFAQGSSGESCMGAG